MRLFVAIQPDAEIIEALTRVQEDLKRQGVTGNYTKPENLHMTLAFIGEFGDPDKVLDAIADSDFRPLKIELEGVGTFGDIFWAGIKENPALSAYVKRLRRSLGAAGIQFDGKRFSPHITLIRKAEYKNGKPIPVHTPPEGGMTVHRISLMESRRGKNGMIYTEISP